MLLLVTWNLSLWNDSWPDVLLHEISCYKIIPNLVCCYMRYHAMKWSPNPCNRMASKIENFVWSLYVRLKWSFPTRVVGITASHHGTQVYIFTLTKPSLDLGPFIVSLVFNFGVWCGGGWWSFFGLHSKTSFLFSFNVFPFFFLLLRTFWECVRWEI